MDTRALFLAAGIVLSLIACETERGPMDAGPDASSDASASDAETPDAGERLRLCEPIPIRRNRCIEDMESSTFLRPFQWAVVGAPEDATAEELLRRFVSTETADLSACSGSLDIDWGIWASLWTTNVIYNDRLSGCDEFSDRVGEQFGARLQAMKANFDDCLFAQVFPDRDDYVQRLRDAGSLAEMSYFLTGITPAESAAIPEACTNVDCAAAALFGDRADAILRVARETGYVLQDWGIEDAEQIPWGETEIGWIEDALRRMLDCERSGAIYQFEYFPVQHLRISSTPLDAGFNGTGVSVSRYFMVDGAGAPTPERLRFVLGHELTHAASDELGYRRGFDPAVYDGRADPPDPELYFDPEYIAEIMAILDLERDVLIVGGARHPMGFRESDLASGALNAVMFSQPRTIPYARNPPTVSVDDMYSDTPTYHDGLIRSENPRGYREMLSDLLVGYAEFPSLFFHNGLLIAPRGYFFVRENFFGGRNAPELTPEQRAQLDRYEPLSIAERIAAHQTDAATLQSRYCSATPEACVRPELPEPTTTNERTLLEWLTQLGARGREARLAALRTTLDSAGVTYVEEVGPADDDDLPTTNVVVTLGSGPEAVMLGAHWDGLRGGRSVVDNSSGVASLVQVAQRLSADPPDGTVRIVFFDREEEGLLGSESFVAAHDSDLPPLYLNLDMCGYGDTLLVGPTAGSESLLPRIRSAAAPLGQSLEELPALPGASDHESFLAVGVPAISFSMMDRTDTTLLERLIGGDFSELAPILKIIHTQDDSLYRVEPAALVRCAVYIEALVRSL